MTVTKWHVYLAIVPIGILLAMLGYGRIEIGLLNWALFIISTMGITFVLIPRQELEESNFAERPKFVIERHSSFNWPNYIRSGILVAVVVLMVPTMNWWLLTQLVAWVASAATIAYPWWQMRKLPFWDLLCEAIWLEFQTTLTRKEVAKLVMELDKHKPKSILAKQVVKLQPKLTLEQAKQLLSMYLKLLREV